MKECFICKTPAHYTIRVEGKEVCLRCRDENCLSLAVKLLKEIEELKQELEEVLREKEVSL